MKTIPITSRHKEETVGWLEAEAKRRGISRATFISAIVRTHKILIDLQDDDLNKSIDLLLDKVLS